jgi:hypothetical protein
MAATAVSLGLSLTLAVLLLAMAVAAESRPAPSPESLPVAVNAPTDTPQEPDLGVVYLPPPPAVAVEIAPEAAPALEPAVTPPKPPAPAEPLPAPAAPPIPEPVIQQAVVRAAPPPAPEPAPAPIEITPEAVREGRALLRLLERGEGPDIEIAWPAAAADRSDLYRLFSNCFGMRTIVMTAGGDMYDATGGRVDAGAFNADRYSGFVRQPSGGLSPDEQGQVEAIRRRHGLEQGRVLRLFPRRIDAILLGGLQSIAGDSFDKGVRIRARYRAVANGIEVAGLQIDGRAATEIIVLPYTAQRTCR